MRWVSERASALRALARGRRARSHTQAATTQREASALLAPRVRRPRTHAQKHVCVCVCLCGRRKSACALRAHARGARSATHNSSDHDRQKHVYRARARPPARARARAGVARTLSHCDSPLVARRNRARRPRGGDVVMSHVRQTHSTLKRTNYRVFRAVETEVYRARARPPRARARWRRAYVVTLQLAASTDATKAGGRAAARGRGGAILEGTNTSSATNRKKFRTYN